MSIVDAVVLHGVHMLCLPAGAAWCCNKIAEAEAAVSVNEKKWLKNKPARNSCPAACYLHSSTADRLVPWPDQKP
jgi:hypothetical protein